MVLRNFVRAYRRSGYAGMRALFRYYLLKVSAYVVGPGSRCPICGWQGRSFQGNLNEATNVVRPNAECPRCQSLERHRSYFLFYEKWLPETFAAKPQLIHVSAERCFERLFSEHAHYRTSSYENPRPGELRLDLCNIELPSQSVDLLIGHRVLCCVEDLCAAVREISRVLTPGGYFVVGADVGMGLASREWPAVGYAGQRRSFGSEDLHMVFFPLHPELVIVGRDLPAVDRRRAGIRAEEYLILLQKR